MSFYPLYIQDGRCIVEAASEPLAIWLDYRRKHVYLSQLS